MTDDQWKLRTEQVAVDDVQIRPADGAGVDFQLNLTGPGFRHPAFLEHKRLSRLRKDHCFHGLILTHWNQNSGRPLFAHRCPAEQILRKE